MSKPKVIVTRRWPGPVEQRLRELFDVELNSGDRPFDRAKLKAAFAAADAVFVTVTDRVDHEVLSGTLKSRLIGNFGVGVDHIDLTAAKGHGLTVTNTPDVLTDATADLAMTLLLMAGRRAGEGERLVRAGAWTGWRPTQLMGSHVTGKTLGIVGLGRIGRAVADRARLGFGMTVLGHGRRAPTPEQAREWGISPCASLDDLLERSDFISLHCPGGTETRHLINAERLAKMKPGAILINTARGEVVDETALARALKKGPIAAAGLDVYEGEPRVTSELLGMENVVLLPHLGSATSETRVAMGMQVVDNAVAFFAGQEPPNRLA